MFIFNKTVKLIIFFSLLDNLKMPTYLNISLIYLNKIAESRNHKIIYSPSFSDRKIYRLKDDQIQSTEGRINNSN